jgi:uncharacterized protein YjiS (DUF1127 family)
MTVVFRSGGKTLQSASKTELKHVEGTTAMSAFYQTNTIKIQSPFGKIWANVPSWITQALVARRERMKERQTIRYLRSLDRETLEDIGVDIHALKGSAAKVARVHPYVVAIATLTGATSLYN